MLTSLKTEYIRLIMMKHLKKKLDTKTKKDQKKKKKKEASETKMALVIMKSLID